MGELKLKAMTLVRDLETEEEFDVLRNFLLTDPKNITHLINFWNEQIPNAPGPEKTEIDGIIKDLKNLLKIQVRVTCSVYSIKEVGDEDKTTEQVAPETKIEETEDPSKTNLHVVHNSEEPRDIKALREKYKDLIKKVNVQALKLKVTELTTNPETEVEGKELANFILGKGLYQGKKVKHWDQTAINEWVTSCKPKAKVEDPGETDLNIKYANYLGDNAPTLAGLKVEAKFLLSHNEADKALEVVTFLLSEGKYTDLEGEPFKWSNSQIEDFIVAIRKDLEEHPMDLGEKDAKATTDMPKNLTGDAGVNPKLPEDVPPYDVKMTDFYESIKKKIVDESLSEDDIKRYVLDSVREKKIENLEGFYDSESTHEELESMYVTFFISYVAEQFKQKDVKKVDIKEEIVKLITTAVANKEKGFSTVIKKTLDLYRARGQNVIDKINIVKAKKIVYDLLAEKYPQYHAEVMKTLGEKEKVAIVQETENFEIKNPEIWETVKDAKCLTDVFNMGRELEKQQSFQVVSEMITHLISSGKINDNEGVPVKWDKAQIEIWINNMFKNAETIAEAEVKAKKVDPTDVVASKETTDAGSTEKASPVDIVPPPIPEVALSDSAAPAPETSAETKFVNDYKAPAEPVAEITYPDALKVMEGDEDYKELYAAKKQGFWQAMANTIKRLTAEGKSKKEITHILADKIITLAKNDDYTQCHVRNYKRVRINELYNVVNKIASGMGIEGWVIE